MFDLLVFIGRFQPFHNGHARVVSEALKQSKNVLVLVGSAGSARNTRNPFTYEERREMIHSGHPRIIVRPIYDMTYNDTAWVRQIQTTVNKVALDIINKGGYHLHGTSDLKIGLIGASKDHTSFYLKLFPQWDSVDVPLDENILHAKDIRKEFFTSSVWDMNLTDLIPPSTFDFLYDFEDYEPAFEVLKEEFKFVDMYKKQWEVAPYPVKHVTVDAVVEQSGHILLVHRKSNPGRGLFALPGGHLEENERIFEGIIRELREETLLKVPDPVLRGSVKEIHVFDDPERSQIGRLITHAAHIKLEDLEELPKVKGSDDADKAFWKPIADIRENEMFDDHYHIIQYFTGA